MTKIGWRRSEDFPVRSGQNSRYHTLLPRFERKYSHRRSACDLSTAPPRVHEINDNAATPSYRGRGRRMAWLVGGFTHPATVRTAGARTLLRPAHRVARGRLLALGLLLGTGRGGGGGGFALTSGHLDDMLMRGCEGKGRGQGGGCSRLLPLVEFVAILWNVMMENCARFRMLKKTLSAIYTPHGHQSVQSSHQSLKPGKEKKTTATTRVR